MILQGKAHRFDDNVTTDDIIAGKYKHRTMDLDELADHIMENIRPGFRTIIEPGDFIVAGANFGCGSSREQAPRIIKHVGISAVIAESFARIFFRNAINIGLLPLICKTDDIQSRDTLIYEPEQRQLIVPERDLVITTPALPPDLMDILKAGGLLAYVRQRGGL